MSQFLLDYLESLADEVRGAHRNLVLVLYPVFVIHLDNRVKNLLGSLYDEVVVCQVNHRCLFVCEFGREFVLACCQGIVYTCARYINYHVLSLVVRCALK